jgi:hypothetical protein
MKKARYRKFFDGKQKTVKNLVSSLFKNQIDVIPAQAGIQTKISLCKQN